MTPTLSELAKALDVLEALEVTPRQLLAYQLMKLVLSEEEEPAEAAEILRMRADDATEPCDLGQDIYEQAANMADSLDV